MKLSFGSSYLSIHSFPDTELPNFCLLTGPNGAGKSHFLQALLAGNIKSDAASNQNSQNSNEIRLFDWNTLIPQDTGIFTSDVLRNERANLFSQFITQMQHTSTLEPLRNFVRANYFEPRFLSNPLKLLELSEADFTAFAKDTSGQKLAQLNAARDQVTSQMMARFDVDTQSTYRSITERCNKPLVSLSEADFLSTTMPNWGQVNLFQQSFARLFVAYRDLQLTNSLREFHASKGRDVTFLTKAEFEAANGPAPWDFVNNSLASANLDFRINAPEPDDYTAFQAQLTKISSGALIPFGNLSSGEKILMSFAFCVYYSNDRRQLSSCPKLILLDEVDAPLHPSMSRNLLATVQESMVQNFGIKVIATTHSPSTVALAPEEAIYAMKPNVAGIHKMSRSQALEQYPSGMNQVGFSNRLGSDS